ncbi:MAG: hypothetical protein KIT32_12140 [Rhodocyclaceae bacterium]|nr:hypothetical protein [Rhodocyclaceae bacterium]
MIEKLKEALRLCADCLEDVASGEGGWAWEEVLNEARAAIATPDWLPIPREIDTTRAPFDGELVDIWVSGPGARRIADCRWAKPTHANWGDRYGCDRDLPHQFVTPSGTAMDRRNGKPTHYRPRPNPPTENDDAQ